MEAVRRRRQVRRAPGLAIVDAHRAAGRGFRAAGVGSFVREAGDGEPVLCLHGIPASSFLYRKVLPVLARKGLRGVAFDLPGLGLAERPPGFGYDWTGLGAGRRWPSTPSGSTASTSSCTISAGRSGSSCAP